PLALIYSEIMPEVVQDFQQAIHQANRTPFWQRFWHKLKRPASVLALPQQTCPFCQSQAEIEERLASEFINLLTQTRHATRLEPSTGLCRQHSNLTLSATQNKDQRGQLATWQLTRMQANLAELAELLRKHDYRFLNEAQGEEMTAWRRAVMLMVGNQP